jgi:hypothetical protein
MPMWSRTRRNLEELAYKFVKYQDKGDIDVAREAYEADVRVAKRLFVLSGASPWII